MKVEVRLKKSLIGYPRDQKWSAKVLGLKKVGDKKVLEATPQIMGVIEKIKHLLEVKFC